MAAAHPVALPYRLCFNWFEPLMAFAGALQVLFDPASYVALALPNQRFIAGTQPLYTQISGGWLILAFHDAVTLRVYNRNVQVWKLVLAAGLVSDLIYYFSAYQELGFDRFVYPSLWEKGEWITFVTGYPPLLMKVAFLLGLGVGSGTEKVVKRS